jgi:hypothetical protein
MADPATYTKGSWTDLLPAATKAKLENIENGIKANNDAMVAETDAGRAITQAADAAAQRTLLNVEDGADVTANNAPKAHTASHKHGGTDEIATATPAPNAIPKADGSGKLDGWVTGAAYIPTANEKTRLSDIQAASGATTAEKITGLVDFIKTNLLNHATDLVGYYISVAGSLVANASYRVSDYIPVVQGKCYRLTYNSAGNRKNGVMRFVCCYNANKTALGLDPSSATENVTTFYPATAHANTAYVRITYAISSYDFDPMIEEFSSADEPISQIYYAYAVKILGQFNKSIERNRIPYSQKAKAQTVAAGATLSLAANYVARNTSIVARVSANTFVPFLVGRGYPTEYNGYWLEITETEVKRHRYLTSDTVLGTYSHGLTIGKTLSVLIKESEATADITLYGESGEYTITDVEWFGHGITFIYNSGASRITADLSFTASDCIKDVWLLGDSYLGYAVTDRWPYYVINAGYGGFLIDAESGASSSTMFSSFVTMLTMYRPKYAVWCLGMNDPADGTTLVDATWLSYVQRFIALCGYLGIIPILATIPSTPTKSHKHKNTWVRASQCRYIDFAAAVESGLGDGTWKTGMLAGDNFHPTVIGAYNLAIQVMNDFPEIMVG